VATWLDIMSLGIINSTTAGSNVRITPRFS
jgi:hypothetical protein